MPSASGSHHDAGADAITHEFTLLVKALAQKDLSGDDFLLAFQEIDRRGKGYLSSKSDAIDVICDAMRAKYQRRLDFDLILKTFRTKNDRFDYIAFCEAFEKHRHSMSLREKTPTNPREPVKSPLRSPQKRGNWLIEKQQQLGESSSTESPRDSRESLHRMRLDPRLETQRLLSQSIRRKLLHGVIGAQNEGFQGIQEVLFHLDETGDGYLDDQVFERELLRRLKKPLTKQEAHFLLANLRVRSDSESDRVVHYEHLASFCNLDSDASADETEDDPGTFTSNSRPQSPSRDSQALGADFLAAEKSLRTFFQQTMASIGPTDKTTAFDTPRSIVTGAEQFLERAEAIDKGKTGFLCEDDFYSIFTMCRLSISPGLVRAMLARFPRSSDQKINYRAFLERYGEKPELARERRKLKRLLSAVLAPLASREAIDWIHFLTQRLEKYDARLHTRCRGDVPAEQFVHTLRGSSSSTSASSSSVPVTLSVDVASDILTQFLRVSRISSASAVVYSDFLRILRDCHAQTFETPGKPAQTSTLKLPTTSTASTPSTFAVTNVADYLIHEASIEERQHFEELMEALHKFKQHITTRAEKKESGGVSQSPRATGATEKGHTETPKHKDSTHISGEARETPQIGAITPIENGISMALGAKLHVHIQFTTI